MGLHSCQRSDRPLRRNCCASSAPLSRLDPRFSPLSSSIARRSRRRGPSTSLLEGSRTLLVHRRSSMFYARSDGIGCRRAPCTFTYILASFSSRAAVGTPDLDFTFSKVNISQKSRRPMRRERSSHVGKDRRHALQGHPGPSMSGLTYLPSQLMIHSFAKPLYIGVCQSRARDPAPS